MAKSDDNLNVSLDGEGFLVDFSQWTKEIGLKIAAQEEIEMTDQHWKVIAFIQECHQASTPLFIRTVGTDGPVSIKEFYTLFKGTPLKTASRIAGIPKPDSCI